MSLRPVQCAPCCCGLNVLCLRACTQVPLECKALVWAHCTFAGQMPLDVALDRGDADRKPTGGRLRRLLRLRDTWFRHLQSRTTARCSA